MGIDMIGKQIAAMRKEKGIRQEELAGFVGVSTQAVSKWENGGVPDTELIPKIADFFSVSIDTLFGRELTGYSDAQAALMRRISEAPQDERIGMIFDCCWAMERASCGETRQAETSLEECGKAIAPDAQVYSSVIENNGFTRMGIANQRQYFLVVPEPKDVGTAYLDGVDYTGFFRDIGDKTVFDACVFLNGRESGKAFTPMLLVKNLGIDVKRAQEVLNSLAKYHMVRESQIEMDDEVQTIYYFVPTPSFVALLIFAHEIINVPHRYMYYTINRNKPYLK